MTAHMATMDGAAQNERMETEDVDRVKPLVLISNNSCAKKAQGVDDMQGEMADVEEREGKRKPQGAKEE